MFRMGLWRMQYMRVQISLLFLVGQANAVLANIAISTIASQTDAVGLAQNLYLVNPGTNFTVGGGSLVVGITYNIITL